MEQWTYNKTYFGISQGSGCSTVIANIYLNELDEFMQELKEKFDVGDCNRRKVSYEYDSVRGRAKRLKKKYAKDWNEISEEERKRRAKEIRDLRAVYTKLPRYDARDTGFKKIQYTRYCDDFLVGVIGSREDAETIKAQVKKFLAEELNLTLSDEKTKITHTSECAEFLGYRIKVSRNEGIKLVLVYKCGQGKWNNRYDKGKEQRRCGAWRKTKNVTLRNASSRSWICIIPEKLRIHNWNVNME